MPGSRRPFDLRDRVHDPHPGKGQAFLESRSLADGRTAWRVPVDAAASALVPVPGFSCVVFALLSGRVGALDLSSGALLWEDQASIDGLPTIVTALAARNDRVAAGTICGRTIILRIATRIGDDGGHAGWPGSAPVLRPTARRGRRRTCRTGAHLRYRTPGGTTACAGRCCRGCTRPRSSARACRRRWRARRSAPLPDRLP